MRGHRLLILALLALSKAIASPTQLPLGVSQLPDVDVDDAASDPSHLIFASFVGLLKQLPNTYYPNGHSVVLGTVLPSTLLYHARTDSKLPPSPEWLAFDAEMSYGIMTGRQGATYLLTYTATRPLRVLYLDGQSAALSDTGWLDSQAVLIYGNVTKGDRAWAWSEYERARALCQLGSSWGFDGVVRMNAGFELLYCDFDVGLQLLSHLNVTDPLADSSSGFPAPPDSPDHASSNLISYRSSPSYPTPPGGPGGPGSRPRGPGGPGRWSQPTSPYAASSNWEWQRSASWHYWRENRVILDTSTFITFYDPAVKSLALIRARDGTQTTRHKQRLLGIDPKEAIEIKERVRLAVQMKNQAGWAESHGVGVGVDRMVVAESITDRFGGRIEEIRWFLRDNSTLAATSAGGTDNSTTRALAVHRIAYMLLFPYLDMTNHTRNIQHPKPWISAGQQRCQSAYTRSHFADHARQSREERLIRTSIENVVGRICSTLLNILEESLLLDLPIKLNDVARHPKALEVLAAAAIVRWRAQADALARWLGWSTEDYQCDRVCSPAEICQIPVWPLVGMGWPGRGDDEEKAAPTCVSWAPRGF